MPPLVDEDAPPGSDSDSDDMPELVSDEEKFPNTKREDVRTHFSFARPDLVALSQPGKFCLTSAFAQATIIGCVWSGHLPVTLPHRNCLHTFLSASLCWLG